jgi:hypothetical protein
MSVNTFSRMYAFDGATGLEKRAVGAAALTADAYIGTQFDQGAAAMTDMVLVVNIEAIDIASTDEIYRLRVVGSNVADRSDGTILATIECGDASTFASPETIDTAAGDRFVAPFRTEKNGTAYRYVDLHLDVAGTSPSITFNAYLSKEIC